MLEGKVAIVTGASTLIGEKIVAGLVNEGARVTMADIADSEGQEISGRLGPDVSFVRTDVSQDADIEACLDQTSHDFGGVDILVNVAATYLDGGPASTREDFLTGLNVNTVSQFIFAQKAAEIMRARGGGSIINMASISGKVAQPGRLVYASSKAAILHMTRCLAAAWAPDNIRVNSVSPGWTWSNVIRGASNDNRGQADSVAALTHPLGRLGNPEEVANSVVFLASPKASYITGTDIAVDGGYSAIGPERMDDLAPALQG